MTVEEDIAQTYLSQINSYDMPTESCHYRVERYNTVNDR